VSRQYRVNEPTVAAEMHDGDAILINFENGRYYDTEGAGGEVVRLLCEGHAVEQIVVALAERSGHAEREVSSTVESFIAELLAEGLVLDVGPREQARALPAIACVLPSGPLAAALKLHLELEDLLRLDPIHDVDAAGWPLPKASAGS
jgi:Coenzyme PQQ synthesis protein D (PqqD)